MLCDLLIAIYLTVCPVPEIEPIEFETHRIIYDLHGYLPNLRYMRYSNEAESEIPGLSEGEQPDSDDIRSRELRNEEDERDTSRQDTSRYTTELGRRPGNIVDRISYCESGQDNSVSPSTSSASGYFQFIDSTWLWVAELNPPASAYSYSVQLEAFLKLWDEGRGASHWQPSRYCWQYDEPWEHHVRP